jgi:acyl-CoA synthetase (AMP-forming)/AMP-acid ligase II
MLGGSVIITERFSAEQFLSTVEQHRATHAFVVPTMLQAIAALPQFEKADLTSLTSLVSGGAPLPAALQANLSARFGQAFCHLWGLTEGLATLLRSGDRSVPVDCVGWPLPSVELRIAAADGEARQARWAKSSADRHFSCPDIGWALASLVKAHGWRSVANVGCGPAISVR